MSVLTILGVGIGLAAAWALSRVLSAMLYQVGTHDPLTFVAAPAVLLLAAAVATAVPVRRAMRANPTEVMRAE